MRLGTKLLCKDDKEQYTITGVREDEGGEIAYTLDRKIDGGSHVRYVLESKMESLFYFLVEEHPHVQDADRRKSKKKREKVEQPDVVTALSLLN
jgi:hypothetical protein